MDGHVRAGQDFQVGGVERGKLEQRRRVGARRKRDDERRHEATPQTAQPAV